MTEAILSLVQPDGTLVNVYDSPESLLRHEYPEVETWYRVLGFIPTHDATETAQTGDPIMITVWRPDTDQETDEYVKIYQKDGYAALSSAAVDGAHCPDCGAWIRSADIEAYWFVDRLFCTQEHADHWWNVED